MDVRNQVKQLLRMCGHAATGTVHERLNTMDAQIAAIQEQNTGLARNQTALLQSCVYLVETLQEMRKQFQAGRERALGALEQIGCLSTGQQSLAAKTDSLQSRIEQVLETVIQAEQSHATLLQSSIHLIEKLADIQSNWENQANYLRSAPNLVQEVSREFRTVQDEQVHLVHAAAAAIQEIKDLRRIGPANDVLERVAELHQYTRTLLEEAIVRQVCVETDDYAFSNPEVGLMSFLYSHLPTNKVLDVGAHVGDVSDRLLKTGFEVWAFEPYPPSFEALTRRLGGANAFHASNFALGRVDADLPLHVAADVSDDNRFGDSTVFNTLAPHSMPEDLPFTRTILAPVKNLAKLHAEGVVPRDISMVKIDTEGYDIEVVRGMGEHYYPVVALEYWDTRIPFGKSGLLYTLESAVAEMRLRGYPWSLVLYRIWGRNHTAFYCNYDRPVPESWGNVFFFRDNALFAQAQAWCSAVLPRTYFKPAPSK